MPSALSPRITKIQETIGAAQTGNFDIETCTKLEVLLNIQPEGTLLQHIKAIQKAVKTDSDGIVGPGTLTRIEAFLSTQMQKIPSGASMVVSKKGLDMIVSFEVTSKEVYEKKYQQAIWPGGASGVTIGIGYDLGHCSSQQFKTAWGGCLSSDEQALLLTVAGVKGNNAKNVLKTVQSVKIPFAKATLVFYQNDMPLFAKRVKKIYPGVDKLPPDAQAALLSLVYNRGEDIDPNSDRRKEMANIVPLVATGNLAGIAAELRSMKRLWPDKNMAGLRRRRDEEAKLVENATFNFLPEDVMAV